jgi:hypothetical protein
MEDIFASEVRSAGDLAGVYEFDGKVGFFYLYKTTGTSKSKILGAVRICQNRPPFDKLDISIRWDVNEEMVGLLIRSKLCAAFDGSSGASYGGLYKIEGEANIPKRISDRFK